MGMSGNPWSSAIGLCSAETRPSRLFGIRKGDACGGILSGKGGSLSGLGSCFLGAARKGSTVFR